MKRLSVLIRCALLGVVSLACGPGSNPDPGVSTEEVPAVDQEHLTISVFGRAEVFPEAAALLAAQGQPVPSLTGIPVSVEEPLRVLLRDASARFGTSTLSEDGAFRVDDVPVREVHLGLGAGFEVEGFARTTTVFFDTAVPNTRPRTDILDAHAWAVPLAFHDALVRALGEERLQTLSEARARTLLEAGFVLGRVVDAQGQPLAGARVEVEPSELAGRVFYPAEDFSGVSEEATGPHGLFVFVGTGGEAEAFLLRVDGQEDYPPRNAGTAPGVGLALTLTPSTSQP